MAFNKKDLVKRATLKLKVRDRNIKTRGPEDKELTARIRRITNA